MRPVALRRSDEQIPGAPQVKQEGRVPPPARRRIRTDWFLFGMAGAVALAWLFPGPGSRGGALHPEVVNKAGVSLIFFLHGIALPFAALRAGTLRWRLHLVVQSATFLLFPLLGIALNAVLSRHVSPDLRLGVSHLCALPSTVSSSVALTAAARGNVPAAVFNATLSSLIGVVLTPIWVSAAVDRTTGGSLPLGGVILDLVLWLVLPLALGQLCRPRLGAWAARNKKLIHTADRATILLLVYTSFCDSVRWGVWSGSGLGPVLITLAASALLFAGVFLVVDAICDGLRFTREDRIAAVFCGSKKSLAAGVPMAQLIFGSHPGLGLILLPILLYHPLQLVVCGALAGRWASETPPDELATGQATG